MKKAAIIIILALLFIFVTGCDQDKAEEATKSIPVMVYEVGQENISSYIKLTGGLEAGTDLDLYSMSSEKLKKIHVKEGSRVEAGELLAEQDNNLVAQGVNLAEAGVNSARANLELVEKEYLRMERLLAKEAVTQQQFDQVEMQKKSAEAGLALAEAQLQQAKEQLNYTKIFAPVAGEIAMIYYKEGEMVPAGVPVVKMVNSAVMTARLKASEQDMEKFYLGQKVTAQFPAFPEEAYRGEITSIDGAIDPQNRTLEIEVELKNGIERLRSGLFGEFLIVTNEREDVIVLSDAAVLTRTKLKIDKNGKQITEKEYYVYLEKGNKAEMQVVKTGVHSLGRLEITEGLQKGDRVIVVGQNIVKHGDDVKIVN